MNTISMGRGPAVFSAGAWHRIVPMACLAVLIGTTASAQQQGLPDKLQKYFDSAGAVSVQQRRNLIAGRPITALLAGDASKEVAVLGAVWIDAPIAGRRAGRTRGFESGGPSR